VKIGSRIVFWEIPFFVVALLIVNEPLPVRMFSGVIRCSDLSPLVY
jgi:hypothetical protein